MWRADGTPVPLDDGWLVADDVVDARQREELRKVVLVAATPAANFHGVVVERHGALLAEFYFAGHDQPLGAWFSHEIQFGSKNHHDLRSISKSVVALAVGVAHSEGKIPDLGRSALSYFPELADLAASQKSAITLEHLLTMSAGLHWDESGSYARLDNSETRMAWARDPSRYVFSRPVASAAGSTFTYSGGNTLLLAEIVERATGQDLGAYAEARLFKPLGIDAEWKRDRHGKVLAYSGLRMSPRSLLKFGRLLLDHGRWRGQQIVPEAWIAQILNPHLPTGEDGMFYSYQWWLGEGTANGKPFRWIGGIGYGGQRLFIVPELDLSVAITAGRYNQPWNGRASHALLNEIVSALSLPHPNPPLR